MVDIGIEVVHANGVDAEDLHQGSITLALLRVAQRILAGFGVVTSAASRLVSHTNDLELVASVGVDEVLALNLERLKGADGRGGQGHESRLELTSMLVE